METVQILLKDGLNPEAFTAAFQKLMREFPDITPESIQGVDKKENDVLLTLKVPEGTDKGKVEQIWDEVYQARLEAQMRAEQLKAKDEIIAIQKHYVDVFEELMKGVFRKGLIINNHNHNQSTAENKVASDNSDQSRKAKISGGTVNAIGAGSLSLGDNDGTTANTMEQLPDSATNPSQEDESISQSEDVESLRAIAEKYKAELKYKDHEIDLYRDEIEQLRELNEILAKQPLSINIIQEDK